VQSFGITGFVIYLPVTSGKVSKGKVNTDTVNIADIDNINWTKNQEKGTISTQIINFGNACFSSHLSHFQIIFINAITISNNANIKYTTFEIKIHMVFKCIDNHKNSQLIQLGFKNNEINCVSNHINIHVIIKTTFTILIAVPAHLEEAESWAAVGGPTKPGSQNFRAKTSFPLIMNNSTKKPV